MAKEDFYLSDEQRMSRDLARKVAREKVAPHAAYVDETDLRGDQPDPAPRHRPRAVGDAIVSGP